MKENQISYESCPAPGTVVYLAVDGTFAGSIVIRDGIKEEAFAAIRELKEVGVRHTVMLTGDRKEVGEAVAEALGLDEVYTELLPGDKVSMVESLLEQTTGGGKLAFVGDGMNDAPVLSRADLGIAMGTLGSDAAIEAADVVLMDDQPSKLVQAIPDFQKDPEDCGSEYCICAGGQSGGFGNGPVRHSNHVGGCVCGCGRSGHCHLQRDPGAEGGVTRKNGIKYPPETAVSKRSTIPGSFCQRFDCVRLQQHILQLPFGNIMHLILIPIVGGGAVFSNGNDFHLLLRFPQSQHQFREGTLQIQVQNAAQGCPLKA